MRRQLAAAYRQLVIGNHDLSLDPEYTLKYKEGWSVVPGDVEACRELVASYASITYVQHSSTTINLPEHNASFRLFGSPDSPERPGQNWAFQYVDGQAAGLWDAIPTDTDVLITHTPPAGHCDESRHWQQGGCPALMQALWKVKPALHICGHCHDGRGAQIVRWNDSPEMVESVQTWKDPGAGNKKQSLLDLTGARHGPSLEIGKETAVVNAAIMSRSWGKGSKAFNKPIVVDVEF